MNNLYIDNIKVDDILHHDKYLFDKCLSSNYMDSYDEYGISEPVNVAKIGEKIILLEKSFFYDLANASGIPEIPCRIFNGENIKDVLDSYVKFLSHSRNLTVMQRILLAEVLINAGYEKEEVVGSYFKIFKFPLKEDVFNTVKQVYSYPDPIKNYINDNELPLNILYLFREAGWRNIKELINFVDKIKPSHANLKQIIETSLELALMKDCSILEILDAIDSKRIEANEDITNKEKTEIVKQNLLKLRYPNIVEYNTKMKKVISALKLPRGVTLEYPNDLESDNIEIVIKADTAQHFKKALNALSQDSAGVVINDVFKIMKSYFD